MKRTLRLAGSLVLATALAHAPAAFGGEKDKPTASGYPAGGSGISTIYPASSGTSCSATGSTAKSSGCATGSSPRPLILSGRNFTLSATQAQGTSAVGTSPSSGSCVVRPVYVVSVAPRTTTPLPAAAKPVKNVELIQELIAILNETKSPDVLLITMETLVELKAEPRLVIPAVIKNAERLDLLKGMTTAERRTKEQEKVLECLEYFTKRTRMVVKWKRPATTRYQGEAERFDDEVPFSRKREMPTTAHYPCQPGAPAPSYDLPPPAVGSQSTPSMSSSPHAVKCSEPEQLPAPKRCK